MDDQPKYPLFFRILAVLNLLAGMMLIFFTCWFLIGELSRFYFIAPVIAHAGLWLIIGAFAWFLSSGKSLVFLYTTSVSVLLFMAAIVFQFFFYKEGSELEKIIVTTLAAFSVLYSVFNLIAVRSGKTKSWNQLNSTLTKKNSVTIIVAYVLTISAGYAVYYLTPESTDHYATHLGYDDPAYQVDADDQNYSEPDRETILEESLSERTFSENELLNIYETVVTKFEERPVDWAFREEGDSIVLNGITFREFIGGPIALRQLILPAIAEVKKIGFSDIWEMTRSLKSEVRIFSFLSDGIPVTNDDEKVAASDGWPEIPYAESFVHWAYSNFIPHRHDIIYGHEAGDIYDIVFSRFFRLLVESYYELNMEMNPDVELDWYHTVTDNAVYDLWERYQDVLPKYIVEDGIYYFAPELAMGFWLRRKIDGKERIVFDGLTVLMNRFDKEWFSQFNAES